VTNRWAAALLKAALSRKSAPLTRLRENSRENAKADLNGASLVGTVVQDLTEADAVVIAVQGPAVVIVVHAMGRTIARH
jgi:hypothetical protein